MNKTKFLFCPHDKCFKPGINLFGTKLEAPYLARHVAAVFGNDYKRQAYVMEVDLAELNAVAKEGLEVYKKQKILFEIDDAKHKQLHGLQFPASAAPATDLNQPKVHNAPKGGKE